MDIVTNNSSLLTLAILKVNHDKQHRYIDTFMPFILDVLYENPTSDLELIQSNILDKYKLKIPLNSLKTIVRRANQKKIIDKKEDHYAIVDEQFKKNYDATRNKALREQNQLINKLVNFCQENHDRIINENEAEDAIFNYIRFRDIELLRSTVFGSPFRDNSSPRKEITYHVGQFVTHISEKDQQTFELLHSYIKSYVLSELMIFENISDIEKPFKNIDFYLDTQFVLRTLGYTYQPLAKACNELVELLYTECGNLFVFDHTVDEVIGILRACQSELYKQGPKLLGEVGMYCMDNYITASDIEIIINSINDLLKEKRIGIVATPEHTREFAIAESQLVDYLNLHYKYKNPRARDRDIDSIQAVYRLRKGKKPNSIRDCGAVFVTTNSSVAKHTYAFFYNEENYTHFPLVITDHLATNLVWSRKTDKYDAISRNQRLADAFALTNPNDHMWEKYCQEIEKLVTQNRMPEEEAMLFLYSSEVRTAIMDITKGGEVEPGESNIFEIITAARKRLSFSDKEKINKLQDKLKESKKFKQESFEKDSEIAELKQKLNIQEKKQQKTVRRIKKIAYKSSKIISWIIMLIPIVCVIIALFNFAPEPYATIFSSILGILTFFSLIKGINLLGIRRKVELIIEKRILNIFNTN